MTQARVNRYRRWFEYENDSHAKVLASLHSVPAEQRAGPAFEKAVSILGHIIAARLIWLARFGVLQQCPKEFFPTGLTLADLASQLASMQKVWESYLDQLQDADLDREFEYQSSDAGRFRNTIEEILTQLFGHSWYHRGQIASLVKAAGGKPAITDFVYWARQPVATVS